MIRFSASPSGRLAAFATALALAACAAPQPTADGRVEGNIEQAATRASDAVMLQVRDGGSLLDKAKGLAAAGARRAVVVDPVFDPQTGQQSVLTRKVEGAFAATVAARFAGFEVLPFTPENLQHAQLVLGGTATAQAGIPHGWKIELAVTDVKAGRVVARASAIGLADAADAEPLGFYRDSPVLLKDGALEDRVRNLSINPGQPADATYLARLQAGAAISEATESYNRERYQDALKQYRHAQGLPDGDQMRTQDGIYLSSTRLALRSDAESAFGKLVSAGIANNSLSVKFLFNPGGTTFWADPAINTPYAMWLHQIATAAAAARVCINVIGNTSKTGTAEYNDRLSLERAGYIRQRLAAESPALAPRLTAVGVGFRDVLVGTGTDDVRDALDRRVEFRIVPCPAN